MSPSAPASGAGSPTSTRAPSAADGPRPPSSPRSWGWAVLGGGLIVVGLAWAADVAGLATLRWPVLVAAALVVVGLGLLATARRGGHGGLVIAGIVVAAVALTTSVAQPVGAWTDVGERTVRPQSAADLAEPITLSMGSLTVDLRDVDLSDGAVPVDVSVGLGELVVILPADAGAAISASAGAGEVALVERRGTGVGVAVTERIDGDPAAWQIDLSVGMGRVEVRR